MPKYHPHDADVQRLTDAVKHLSQEEVVALYRMLCTKHDPSYSDPMEWFGEDATPRRIILRNLFEGTYTIDQLRPYGLVR